MVVDLDNTYEMMMMKMTMMITSSDKMSLTFRAYSAQILNSVKGDGMKSRWSYRPLVFFKLELKIYNSEEENSKSPKITITTVK